MEISLGVLLLLALALALALTFEACNGFHDTANAVATVIYTKSLTPTVAVVWSGLVNFLGVLLGGIAVAFSIVHLLPADLLVRIDSGASMAMIFALLIAALVWNLGTWYYGIPSSSSHALIGAIVGVGLAHSLLAGQFGAGVNWSKAVPVFLSLFISPLVGFVLAALLLLLMLYFLRDPKLHAPPEGDRPPPWHIRSVLILTCTGISFAHGSNDGQKGIGLIMLILIGLVPAHYALNPAQSPEQFRRFAQAPHRIQAVLQDPEVRRILAADPSPDYPSTDPGLHRVEELLSGLTTDLDGKTSLGDLDTRQRWDVRTQAVRLDQSLGPLQKRISKQLAEDQLQILSSARGDLRGGVEYAPTWVIGAVALALGVGTMIGWKRIVVTVGEKIGKTNLTYSQGAAAELVAMSTIGMADVLGMPVSTTHVLSSGVAGTMAANNSGLRGATVRGILLAWVLTLPVCITLAGVLFLLFRLFV